ncbi:MAG: prephenate dehydrogenase/arogenate dehydrogenase family protein [Nevskiaceae bacterium]|nr:MAG: prephenate dehydrogenase/arogenate dehydrogenase family protein [Nevskiaceae bacterium]TBR74779.1 MAG: prephenate dehydrogenase/arogenate dehydrogenase family protein [Nevskiaceae bacterium]
MIAQHLAVVGLGLIGGSVARAARAAGIAGQITGFDVDARQREQALELGVVDAAPDTVGPAVTGADLVVLAVPVLETGLALDTLRGALAPDAVLTDVGSTKSSVIAIVKHTFRELPPNFVPAHPIAGTEKTGVAASDAGLFRNRHVIITPHEQMSPAAAARVEALWEAFGATVERMTPEHHDEIFAATSHLPHVLSFTLVDMLARMSSSAELFNYAAGGFRDFTRIAGSSPKMWHDIVRANRSALVPLIDRYMVSLKQMRHAIATDDPIHVLEVFTRARNAREHYEADQQRRSAASEDGTGGGAA